LKIVIPSNSAERLRRCVAAILDRHVMAPSDIIVVDDGARADWTADDPAVTWVPGIKPFLYARNANIGLAAADDDAVLMGDDVLVKTPGAFDLLAETSRRTSVGAVSPAIDGVVGNPLQKRVTSSAVRESARELCFVCVYLPQAALQRVGGLDERFVGYGCEDVDWCWRAQADGWRLLIDDRALVIHNGPGMESAFRSKPEIREMSAQARELLREKWPGRFE
jgi:GT2 family glycosyltransferase